jgi:hypothetical protein
MVTAVMKYRTLSLEIGGMVLGDCGVSVSERQEKLAAEPRRLIRLRIGKASLSTHRGGKPPEPRI